MIKGHLKVIEDALAEWAVRDALAKANNKWQTHIAQTGASEVKGRAKFLRETVLDILTDGGFLVEERTNPDVTK